MKFRERRQAAPGKHTEVSIIMTMLNESRFLAEAIESVIAQRTTRQWELLIVDDGSSDGSYQIACEYAARWPRNISVFQHAGGRNRGISASRNLALQHATAPVIAFLDADDVWYRNNLDAQMAILEEHPQAAMVYAQAERWYDFDGARANGSTTNYLPPLIPEGERAGLLAPPKLLEWFLSDESMAPCTCTVLVRTEAARNVGGFDNHFEGLYDDQVFYAKMALSHSIFVSLACVARYRQHPASYCAVARKAETGEQARRLFLAWLAEYTAGLRPSNSRRESASGAIPKLDAATI